MFNARWFAPPQKNGARKSTNFAFRPKNVDSQRNRTRGNQERVVVPLAGGALRALPRWLIGKTLTVNRVPWQSARKVSWLLAGQVDPLGAPLEITQRLVNEYCDSMSFAPTRPCTSECETWAAEALDDGCPVVQCHMKAQLRCSAGASRPAMHPG